MCDELDCTNEEGAACLFPSSWANSHEANNPFRVGKGKEQHDLTLRYSLLPTKPSMLDYFLSGITELTINKASRTAGDINLIESESDNSPIDTLTRPQKPQKAILSRTYCTELNPELIKQFKQLVHFRGIDESWVKNCKVNLRHQKTYKKTLILDLDGTLICSARKAEDKGSEGLSRPKVVTVVQVDDDGTKSVISYYIRPHAMRLLKTLRFLYEIIVFTAGTESYAKAIVESLDPKKQYITYLLHRDQCIKTKNWIIKDLRVIGRRKLKDMIMVDNSVISFAGNLDSGIYVPSYEGDLGDQELLPVIEFLKEVYDVEDVRPYVHEFAGINKLISDYKAKFPI
eukprot:TRINITY_DN7246_c0_g1_i11.p1 TRINITY_DN7246_c0_g1~~TRINITY_DN7246_c0_g1_i11.p1  ORF type:complete len:343 (-),score=51.41 TRINITY_DN7246_c0_g1_i11:146-1174(-)